MGLPDDIAEDGVVEMSSERKENNLSPLLSSGFSAAIEEICY